MPVLDSVETLDKLQDWLTAQNPWIVAELGAEPEFQELLKLTWLDVWPNSLLRNGKTRPRKESFDDHCCVE